MSISMARGQVGHRFAAISLSALPAAGSCGRFAANIRSPARGPIPGKRRRRAVDAGDAKVPSGNLAVLVLFVVLFLFFFLVVLFFLVVFVLVFIVVIGRVGLGELKHG
jgi:hypothetical protein